MANDNTPLPSLSSPACIGKQGEKQIRPKFVCQRELVPEKEKPCLGCGSLVTSLTVEARK